MRNENINKARFVIELVIAIALVIFILMEYIQPLIAVSFYGDEYKRLTYECDRAMHDEAATRIPSSDSQIAELLRISSDVGLSVCHKYDKLRKRLLILGVSENRLSLLGLDSLEIEEIPVSRMVDPHKMDRF